MKNIAFIVGGTSGIGKELAKNLEKNYEIHNFSRTKSNYIDCYIDLSKNNSVKILTKETLIKKPNIIILSAGIGYFGLIKELNSEKINNVLDINAVNYIKYLTKIWNFLVNNSVKILFVSSTSSYISGVAESYYSLSKKMLSSFCDSLRTELIFFGSSTTVTEFVMHYTPATNMHKITPTKEELGEFELECKSAIKAMENKKSLYIPKYSEVYEKIFNNYHQNPTTQGLSSLQYKKNKGRV